MFARHPRQETWKEIAHVHESTNPGDVGCGSHRCGTIDDIRAPSTLNPLAETWRSRANSLLDTDAGQVRFRYTDYRHGQQPKTMTLAADEFIRRVLLHVLPPGFHRMRYYGFLGNRHRIEKLARCRHLLGMAATLLPPDKTPPPPDYRDRPEVLTGISLRTCPSSRDGHMLVIESLAKHRSRPAFLDSS